MNRSIFGIVYLSICFFAAILGLKDAGIASAVGFFVLMLIITYVVDIWITNTFVNPSITLALTNARIIDEETKVRYVSAIILFCFFWMHQCNLMQILHIITCQICNRLVMNANVCTKNSKMRKGEKGRRRKAQQEGLRVAVGRRIIFQVN